MELYYEKTTYYYRYKGEINTDHVIRAALKRAQEQNIEKVVVASETGRSALKALEIIREQSTKAKLIVVTHPPASTTGPHGDIPIGLGHPKYSKIRKCLLDRGAIIVQGTRPLAPLSRSLGWRQPLPETIIDELLGGVFGQGVKIAIEAAVIATDTGAVNRGEVVVSLGGTYKGLDSAVLVKTTYSYLFFKEFELLEIIAKPWKPRVKQPEVEDTEWRGDIEKYYREPVC